MKRNIGVMKHYKLEVLNHLENNNLKLVNCDYELRKILRVKIAKSLFKDQIGIKKIMLSHR